MVRWIKDATGRFPRRPYYEDDEFEDECDAIISAHFRAQHTEPCFPIPTNELVILLEKEVSIVDIYSELEQGVDGQTDFNPDGKTVVQIARDLGEQEFRENRLRTTLTHELAHIKFHEHLFRAKALQPPLFAFEQGPINSASCQRATILDGPGTDWLEWQAGFASTAMLMPRMQLRRIVQETVEQTGARSPILLSSLYGRHLVRRIRQAFQVSEEAATIRLLRLNLAVRSSAHVPLL